MKTVLFSDAHLDNTDAGRQRTRHLVAFLQELLASDVRRVVVLGDLFDFWFEYRHVIFSGYWDVLRAFADLRDAGIALHFVCGNHDFWTGRFLHETLGFAIHREPTRMDFAGRRVLLVHGDGLNPRDWSYRIYKRIARARPVVAAFRLLHPDWAMAIARVVSRGSRRRTNKRDTGRVSEIRALETFAQRTLERGEADVVICGHSHHPTREEYPTPSGTGLYVNTGDWLKHESYVTWDGEDFQVRLFGQPSAQQESPSETHRPEQQRDKQPD